MYLSKTRCCRAIVLVCRLIEKRPSSQQLNVRGDKTHPAILRCLSIQGHCMRLSHIHNALPGVAWGEVLVERR